MSNKKFSGKFFSHSKSIPYNDPNCTNKISAPSTIHIQQADTTKLGDLRLFPYISIACTKMTQGF